MSAPIPFEQSHHQRALLIAKHELGHWFANERLGFKSHGITISVGEEKWNYRGEAAVTISEHLNTMAEVEDFLRRRTVTLFAGALAESLRPNGKVDNSVARRELEQGNATNDHKGIRELLRTLNAIRWSALNAVVDEQARLQKLSDAIYNEAVKLVEKDHLIIHKVAPLIANRGKWVGVSFSMSEFELNDLLEIKRWRTKLNRSRP